MKEQRFFFFFFHKAANIRFVDSVAAEEVAKIWVIVVVLSERRQGNGGGGGGGGGVGRGARGCWNSQERVEPGLKTVELLSCHILLGQSIPVW